MAKERVYKVVIDGEEYVSTAAKKAGDGMDDFAKKEPRWIKSFTDLKMAWDAITGAASRVWGAIQSSFDAFDSYEQSLRKMEAQSKLTGVPLSELNEMAERGRKEFGLGRVVANDYATVVGIYASVAGNAALKSDLFAKALQLGAANGLDAAATMQALEQGLRGQDEGFDRLLKRNPSTIWKEYADANGLAVGKMTDTQKRLAEVTALIEAGDKVGNNYAKMLGTAAGQQTLLNNRLEDAKIAVGGALAPMRIFAIELLGEVTERGSAATGSINGLAQSFAAIGRSLQPTVGPLMWLADFMITGLATAFRFAQLDIVRAVLKMEERIYSFIGGVGTAITKAGDILGVFGVKVVRESGDKITAWAKEMNEVTGNELLHLGVKMQDFRADMAVAGERLFGHMSGIAKDNFAQIDEAADDSLGKNVPDASEKAGKAIAANLGPTVQDLLGVTEQSMKDLAKTATMTLDPGKAQAFKGELGHLITKSHEVRDRLMGWTPEVEKATGAGKDLTREVGTIARGALDLAQSFGVVDAEAASVLTSVVNIAQAIPKALGGDLASMGGILAGVANIAKQIVGGDTARRRLLSDNTRSLDRLSKEVSGLRMNVTGESFSGIKGVLEKVVPGLRLGGIENFGKDMGLLFSQLQSAGLNMSDLENVAKSLGINLRDSNGNFIRSALPQLLQAMGIVNPTTVGGGFGDALDQMLTGFSVRGTGGMAQLSSLFGLAASQGASALSGIFDPSNLAGTRAGLLGLFDQLEAGTLDPSQLGGMTGAQFRDFIVDLISRTDDLMQSGSGSGNAPVSDGEEVPTGPTPTGTAPSPALTLADVFRDYASESIPLFTQQIALQTRIADATEATAENTALTVDEVRALREAILGGSFIDGIDRALADRRRDAEVALGQGIAL